MVNERAGKRRMPKFARITRFQVGKWSKIIKDAGIRAE